MKKVFFKFLILLIIALGIVSCAPSVSGIPYKPVANEDIPPDKAVVFFYRPPAMTGWAVSYLINVNNRPVGDMTNGHYFYTFVDSGVVDINATTETTEYIKIRNAEPGKRYYVKCGIKMGLVVGRPSFEQRPESIALTEIVKCKKKYTGI